MSAPVALLGGTFDPVHNGHLHLAEDVCRALALPQVRLVPAWDPPHRSGPAATALDRLAMLRLAVQDRPGLAVDPREIERGGKCYTVVTLDELRVEDASRPILLILGADAFHGLPAWHRWRDVLRLAHVVVAARPGVDLERQLPPELVPEWRSRRIEDPVVLHSTPAGAIYRQAVTPHPISATAIRMQLARGKAGREAVVQLLPAAVLAYIDSHHLYLSTSPPPQDAP